MLGLGLALGLASRAEAVTVSPAALYIDARTRSGMLTLYNPGPNAEEIEIDFAFGYPQTDAAGNYALQLVEEAPAGEPSLVPWLRAFPRRLRLEAGQRQVVRILIQPPADLPDAEYWGRVLVRARGGQPPIEQVQGGVRMQLDIETVVVTAVTYRKGRVQTGLSLLDSGARVADGKAELWLDLERLGNAAFIGRIRAELVAPGGRVVADAEDAVAVYRRYRPVLALPLPAGADPAGFSIRYRIDTVRPDLPAEGPLPAEPLSGTVPLR